MSLDEIFRYLESSEKPCIVAIDEFQAVSDYKGCNMEAILRKYIQHCHNASFIFSGSHRAMMTGIFLDSTRPFYGSTSIKSLSPIEEGVYCDFAKRLFNEYSKDISPDTFRQIYTGMDGTTWYIQRMLNRIFYQTPVGACADEGSVTKALDGIIDDASFSLLKYCTGCPCSRSRFFVQSLQRGRRKE